MVKARRERDRPKARPDALYNPNKRVKLSYGSDESIKEEEEDEAHHETADQVAADESVANYKIEEYVDHEGVEDLNTTHVPGREEAHGTEPLRRDDLDEGEDTQRKNKGPLWSRETLKNQATGQWLALGSLSYQWEDGEDFGEEEEYDSTEEEAMAYLRAVR